MDAPALSAIFEEEWARLAVGMVCAVAGAAVGNLVGASLEGKLGGEGDAVSRGTLCCNALFCAASLLLPLATLRRVRWGRSVLLTSFAGSFCGAATAFGGWVDDSASRWREANSNPNLGFNLNPNPNPHPHPHPHQARGQRQVRRGQPRGQPRRRAGAPSRFHSPRGPAGPHDPRRQQERRHRAERARAILLRPPRHVSRPPAAIAPCRHGHRRCASVDAGRMRHARSDQRGRAQARGPKCRDGRDLFSGPGNYPGSAHTHESRRGGAGPRSTSSQHTVVKRKNQQRVCHCVWRCVCISPSGRVTHVVFLGVKKICDGSRPCEVL